MTSESEGCCIPPSGVARAKARYRLWQATGDPVHLVEAHRFVYHFREHAPEEYWETMITNVPLHRDIMAAWEEHGG